MSAREAESTTARVGERPLDRAGPLAYGPGLSVPPVPPPASPPPAPTIDVPSWRLTVERWLWRLAPGMRLPPGWFVRGAPAGPATSQPARSPLTLEVVSHCWNYSHLLAYQLSSLVLNPPQRIHVRMTVCHCPTDTATVAMLAFFAARSVPGVEWNWLPLRREELMRRAIGRNRAALGSRADWVWFTDCDLVFGEGCLDALAAALDGRTDVLVFPREERCTPMLPPDDPVLLAAAQRPAVVTIEPDRFEIQHPRKATGPLQIARGDAVRRLGYCDGLRAYQAPTERWRKTYEDRAFRWLLGSDGTRVDVPGVYRIKHVAKGRYDGGMISRLRSRVRRWREQGPATVAGARPKPNSLS